jgi:antirestriction protein
MLKIYIANLGKYNEGQLVGEWVTLPVTVDDLKAICARIGINASYEETAIHDFETDLPIQVNEYDNILMLSEAVESFEALSEGEREKVAALLEAGYYDNIADAIDRCHYYTLLPDVFNDYDLGRYFYDEGLIDIPAELVNYFDFEAYGGDLSYDGAYVTKGFLLGY